MVEHVDGRKNYYREALSQYKRDVGFQNTLFVHALSSRDLLDSTLDKLRAKPEADDESILFHRLIGDRGGLVDVLSMPEGTMAPVLFKPVEGLPSERDTYAVEVRYNDGKSSDMELVLVDNDVSAERIAWKNFVSRNQVDSDTFTVHSFLITPQEFVDAARYKIDNDEPVSDAIMRFSGLGEYYQKHLEEKARKQE